jgi:hypothetical protein
MTVAAWAQDTAAPATPADRAADRTSDAAQGAADRTGDAAQRAADTADKAASGQGIRGTIEAKDAEGVRDTLSSSTEASVTKDGFNDLVERFVDADRNRIGQSKPKEADLKPLNDLVTQLRTDWKAKYNQDFDFPDKEEDVFKPEIVRIVQGEFGAQTAGARDVGDKAKDAVKDTADAARQAAADPDSNREKGRNYAIAMIPASHGQPAVDVPLIHELPDAWRIDIPDNVDSAKLLASLQKHLGMVAAQKSQWPADVNDAYLMVSHHLMMGLFEGTPNVRKDAAGGGAQPAGGAIPPATPTPAPVQ